MAALRVKNLYVRFFDVDWDDEKQKPAPVAQTIFQSIPAANVQITPVVFITQEPLQKLSRQGIDSLATNIAQLFSSIVKANHLKLSAEVQIDCDWTAGTRENYFYLLVQLKKQSFFKSKLLSATVRLHQLKYMTQNGVPPADKGLLMCYNMGNLQHPQTKNSIIDFEELKKYTNNLQPYPLPLDIALPVFDWYILFEENHYKGLVRNIKLSTADQEKDRIDFKNDTTINGYAFRKGQWLRHEKSDASVIKKCAEHISKKLDRKEVTVILYHLSAANLSKYQIHELQTFYNSFR